MTDTTPSDKSTTNTIIIGRQARDLNTPGLAIYIPLDHHGMIVSTKKCSYMECWRVKPELVRKQPADIFLLSGGSMSLILRNALLKTRDEMVYSEMHRSLAQISLPELREWTKLLHREPTSDVKGLITGRGLNPIIG